MEASRIQLGSRLNCTGGDSCCTQDMQCEEFEGDCDNDEECKDDLVCGHNNCPMKSGLQWDETDDCCFNPRGR